MKFFDNIPDMFRRLTRTLEDITPERISHTPDPSHYMPPNPPTKNESQMAMDDVTGLSLTQTAQWAAGSFTQHAQFEEGIGRQVPAYLALHSQRSEYRQVIEVQAEEMTRKWIKVHSTGTDDKADKLTKLEDAIKRFQLQDKFREAIELDGIFGGSFLYPDVHYNNAAADDTEVMTKLTFDGTKVAKGSLKGFTVIDPMWCSPLDYNTTNPRDPHFYRPQTWLVNGAKVHCSRLLKITSRPVPDLLKPSYNFYGLSMVQLLKPAVDNFLKTRQSVADLIQSFTIWKFSTDMGALLQSGDGYGDNSMKKRLSMLAVTRDNHNLFLHDKESESLENISAPLGSLDALQSQSLQNIASPARMSLLKMLGYTPVGLNSSTDGEMRINYDTTHSAQEKILRQPLKVALDLIMLSEFGAIDPDISFDFEPLWSMDSQGEAAVLKAKADIATALIGASVISPDEERERLGKDPDSGYSNLKGKAPSPPKIMPPAGQPNNNFNKPEKKPAPPVGSAPKAA